MGFFIHLGSVAVRAFVEFADSSLKNLSAIWARSVLLLSAVTECRPGSRVPLHFPDGSLNY